MSAGHTPGPWKVTFGEIPQAFVSAGMGSAVAICSQNVPLQRGDCTSEEVAANARLIAARADIPTWRWRLEKIATELRAFLAPHGRRDGSALHCDSKRSPADCRGRGRLRE